MIQRDELIKIGTFNKPHGVQGELAFTFTDDIFDRCESPYVVCEIDGIFVPFFIEEYRFRSDTTALMKLEDVDSEEEARPFTNLDVYYPKAYITNDEDGGLSAPGDFFLHFSVYDTEKGFLGHTAYGNSYQYHPIVSKEEFKRKTLRGIIGKYFNNSFLGVVSAFVEEEDVSVEELKELIRSVEEGKKKE